MEAEEAFNKFDTVILPIGTLHGHGPTPISVDSSSVDRIADEVGKRTGLPTLPILPYGENEKQKFYPGSIAISPITLENFYLDIFKSLKRNGVRKVIVLNGHGGNRESLIRAGNAARNFGMIIAILEWWSLGRQLRPDLYPEVSGSFMTELAVAIAIGGKDIADLRGTGYKGEWGEKYTMRKLFGDEIEALGFHNFEYKGGSFIIPIEAWDLDLEGPPVLGMEVVDKLYVRGQETIMCVVNYIVDFAEHFIKVDITDALKSHD
jgi:hypothetical protein